MLLLLQPEPDICFQFQAQVSDTAFGRLQTQGGGAAAAANCRNDRQ